MDNTSARQKHGCRAWWWPSEDQTRNELVSRSMNNADVCVINSEPGERRGQSFLKSLEIHQLIHKIITGVFQSINEWLGNLFSVPIVTVQSQV